MISCSFEGRRFIEALEWGDILPICRARFWRRCDLRIIIIIFESVVVGRINLKVLTMLNTLTIQLHSALWPKINHSQNFSKISLINNINRNYYRIHSMILLSFYDLGIIIAESVLTTISDILLSRDSRSLLSLLIHTRWSVVSYYNVFDLRIYALYSIN